MTEHRFRHDPGDTWWVPLARCVGEDPDLFFPTGTSDDAVRQTGAAKGICGRCTVRDACLEWSLTTCQDAGVWGGLDEEERREIRRARRRRAAIVADGEHLAATG
jgi:WhiB family redox-sensing transcriptional regulator